jgi:predicted phosphodiesterase
VERFAAIADVHGNRLALEAVLEDIARRGVTDIVNAGDHLFGPLDPAGTADLLMGLRMPCVAGNQDRELIDGSFAAPGSTLEHNRRELNTRHLEWLNGLPASLDLPGGILLFHGTPAHNDVYLLDSVRQDAGVSLASADEIEERLGGMIAHSLMLCGHTHIARAVRHSGSRGSVLIVNPGSAGLQAYADDSPVPHVMETGSPQARYAILERRMNGWQVEHRAIDYDWETAAQSAERNGRPDWAWRLRTGRAAAR